MGFPPQPASRLSSRTADSSRARSLFLFIVKPPAADGKSYAVPSSGFWENMFVNTKVLEDCGVAVPGPDYTWDQFLKDCQAIKDKGYTPIACSLFEVPHYWFEFCVMNNGTLANQLSPKSWTVSASVAVRVFTGKKPFSYRSLMSLRAAAFASGFAESTVRSLAPHLRPATASLGCGSAFRGSHINYKGR